MLSGSVLSFSVAEILGKECQRRYG